MNKDQEAEFDALANKMGWNAMTYREVKAFVEKVADQAYKSGQDNMSEAWAQSDAGASL